MSQAPVRIERKTRETQITLDLQLNQHGESKLDTSVPFLDHMLSHICKHGRMKMDLKAVGDLEIDYHHTVEDVAIVLGNAIDKATADMTGVARYGHFTLPMEEVLVTVAIDIRKSPHFEYRVPAIFDGRMGTFDVELIKEFLRAFAVAGRLNLHVFVHYGENRHHIAEAIFKALGRALAMACARDASGALPSTKGVLE